MNTRYMTDEQIHRRMQQSTVLKCPECGKTRHVADMSFRVCDWCRRKKRKAAKVALERGE